MEDNYYNQEQIKEKKDNKKLFVIIFIVIFFLAICSFGIYFGYKQFKEKTTYYKPSPEVNKNEEDISLEEKSEQENSSLDLGQEAEKEFIYDLDTDRDGLTDKQEETTWKTDPNNPDTDGDGFLDGEEAKKGYNPNGEGKIPTVEEILERLKKRE